MAPDVLDALKDADGRELACLVVTVGVQTLDERADSRKLGALLGTIES